MYLSGASLFLRFIFLMLLISQIIAQDRIGELEGDISGSGDFSYSQPSYTTSSESDDQTFEWRDVSETDTLFPRENRMLSDHPESQMIQNYRAITAASFMFPAVFSIFSYIKPIQKPLHICFLIIQFFHVTNLFASEAVLDNRRLAWPMDGGLKVMFSKVLTVGAIIHSLLVFCEKIQEESMFLSLPLYFISGIFWFRGQYDSKVFELYEYWESCHKRAVLNSE